MKHIFLTVLMLGVLVGCSTTTNSTEEKTETKLTGDYFGYEATSEVQVFGEGVISTPLGELNSVFSPDGNEFFYSISNVRLNYVALVHRKRVNGVWQEPKIPSFSGKHSDADPFYSMDGNRLYFISRRPLNDSISEPKDYDIWYVDKEGDSWGDAINMGEKINTKRHEFYISVTKNNTLYYATNYEDLNGPSFIHKAELVNGEYEVTKLGEAVNGTDGGGDPYISPDEDMLIFTSRREGGFGNSDLYISFMVDGQWTKAMNMGPRINSEHLEFCPMISPDGNYFFFTSMKHADFHSRTKKSYAEYTAQLESLENQLGNVYWLKSDFLSELRAEAAQQ